MTRSVVTSPHRVRRFIVCCAMALAILDGAYPSLAQTTPAPPPAREYAQIRDAALADTSKPYTNDQFTASVEALRVFARQRSAFVTAEVAKFRAF